MSYTRGDLDAATAGLKRVLTLAGSVGDMDTVAQAENQLGHIERKLGNLARPATDLHAASKYSGREGLHGVPGVPSTGWR